MRSPSSSDGESRQIDTLSLGRRKLDESRALHARRVGIQTACALKRAELAWEMFSRLAPSNRGMDLIHGFRRLAAPQMSRTHPLRPLR